jgi:hypothetical protein
MALLWFCYYKTPRGDAAAVAQAQRRMAWLLGDPPALQFAQRIDPPGTDNPADTITWLESLTLSQPAERAAWASERERACVASGLRALTLGQEKSEWFEPCA